MLAAVVTPRQTQPGAGTEARPYKIDLEAGELPDPVPFVESQSNRFRKRSELSPIISTPKTASAAI